VKKTIILYLILVSTLFAVDAKMEIIKRQAIIPSVVIKISKDAKNNTLISKIKNLLVEDLDVSGHFQNKISTSNIYFNEEPNYAELKKEGIDLYINLYSQINTLGNLIVSAKLYDINQQQIIFSKNYSTSKTTRYPFVSHRIAIDINDYLNAPPIDWMNKFVVFSRYINPKESEILIADYTLSFQKVIIFGGLNIFPKWTDDKQETFYYTSYKNLVPTLLKYNIYTRKTQKISSSDGMIVCSDISNKSSKIILTMAPNAQPDIYVYDTASRVKTRLTRYRGIDVGGSFVENDSKIVFVSDRLRQPNIFSKTIGEKGVERLVYHGKNNSQCTTYDNYVVYSSRETDNEFNGNSFNLYLISTKSDFVRRLTSTGRNQFPKFSSDGDSILFIKSFKNKSYLGIIRLNYNKSFLFPLKSGKLQSIDW